MRVPSGDKTGINFGIGKSERTRKSKVWLDGMRVLGEKEY
jgi:hypothetical protein